MSEYNRLYDFQGGTTAVADQVDAEFDAIASVLNGNIDSTNLAVNGVTQTALDTTVDPITRDDEILIDFVYSGLTIPTSANLTSAIAAGTAYVYGYRVVKSSGTNKTFTASKDTYVDLDKNGNFTYAEVANGAGAPALTSNSIRIAKVVTNGTAVTAVTQSGQDSNGIQIYNTNRLYQNKIFNPFRARSYRAAAWTTPSAASAKIAMDAESYDPNSNMSASGTYTVPLTGFYLCSGHSSAGNVISRYFVSIYKTNGGNTEMARGTDVNAATNQLSSSVSDVLYLTAGDTIELWNYSGTAVAGETGAANVYFSINFLGA